MVGVLDVFLELVRAVRSRILRCMAVMCAHAWVVNAAAIRMCVDLQDADPRTIGQVEQQILRGRSTNPLDSEARMHVNMHTPSPDRHSCVDVNASQVEYRYSSC